MSDPKPTTPDAYLESLPEGRREALSAVRDVINGHLPAGYKEGMQYGMIGWFVPHSVYPDGYHCDPSQPVPFAGLANQKRHMAIYLFCVYTSPELMAWFVDAWARTGTRLDMGKSCIRFRRVEDVPLELIGEVVSRVPVEAFIDGYVANIPAGGRRSSG